MLAAPAHVLLFPFLSSTPSLPARPVCLTLCAGCILTALLSIKLVTAAVQHNDRPIQTAGALVMVAPVTRPLLPGTPLMQKEETGLPEHKHITSDAGSAGVAAEAHVFPHQLLRYVLYSCTLVLRSPYDASCILVW